MEFNKKYAFSCNGQEADSGVFNRSTFAEAMENGTLNFPPQKPLPGRNEAVPYMIVGDDALRPNIMKPYGGRDLIAPKRIFNYRLSRARRTNATNSQSDMCIAQFFTCAWW